MDPLCGILTGCTVHFPKAKKGDIVVRISREDWAKMSREYQQQLAPYGIIDHIPEGKNRRASVHWQGKEPTLAELLEQHNVQAALLAIFMVFVAMEPRWISLFLLCGALTFVPLRDTHSYRVAGRP